VWSDASHMIPAVNPAYCNVGAGVAKASNGMTYYVLQAAYTTNRSCGSYKPPAGGSSSSGDSGAVNPVSQIIIPVKVATPDADGKISHVVEAGQSFWAIAVAYHITIHDLEYWNNLSRDTALQIGQRLFIPSSSTAGYATPTPVGMVVPSTPDAHGKIIHTVQPYQTLITISQAYHVSVDTIMALNGIQIDWPLQIGQQLLISPGSFTPSPTPRPLTPLEKLTPESDGNYYHVVQSGETLSWIAGLYDITLNDLMSWNGLNAASIIHPGEKLLLQVTPPATPTPTPGPPTATATPIPSQTALSPTATDAPAPQPSSRPANWVYVVILVVLAAGAAVFGSIARKRPKL
jgi:LysM repeat protein